MTDWLHWLCCVKCIQSHTLLFSRFNVFAVWMNKVEYANYLKILEGSYFSKTVFFLINKLTIFTALFLPRVVKSLVYAKEDYMPAPSHSAPQNQHLKSHLLLCLTILRTVLVGA